MQLDSLDEARDVIERVRDSDGDLVIDFPSRIGARPYAKFAPYTNHDDVVVDDWAVISMYFEAMPGKTLRSEPHIVRPSESEDYPLRHFSTPFITQMAWRSRQIKLVDVSETPFAGQLFEYDNND